MHISPRKAGEFLWRVVSEVPGWPDAPLRARIGRILPIAVPCFLAIGAAVWIWSVRGHERKQLQADHFEWLALENDVAELSLTWSEQAVHEYAALAEKAAQRLAGSAEEVRADIELIRGAIRTAGWDASFQIYEPVWESEVAKGLIMFTPAMVRLQPLPETTAKFRSLLTALETVTTFEKRIDVTRLAVRLNDRDIPEVELNLRFATAPNDETITQ